MLETLSNLAGLVILIASLAIRVLTFRVDHSFLSPKPKEWVMLLISVELLLSFAMRCALSADFNYPLMATALEGLNWFILTKLYDVRKFSRQWTAGLCASIGYCVVIIVFNVLHLQIPQIILVVWMAAAFLIAILRLRRA